MARKLFDDKGDELFSPLIDVVMGSLGAFFTLLVVYMILFHDQPTPIRFLQVELPPGIQGQNFVFTFPVTGGTGIRKFTVFGDLPDNLKFQPDSGTLYGTLRPLRSNAGQEFQFQVQVTDDAGQDIREAILKINPVAIAYDPERTPLQLMQNAQVLKAGRIGFDYEEVIGAMGGIEPYSWQVVDGKLPPGLTVEHGYLRGIPESTGIFTFSIQVRHGLGSFVYNGANYSWAAESDELSYQMEIFDQFEHKLELPIARVQDPYFGGVVISGTMIHEHIVWDGIPPGLYTSSDGRFLIGTPIKSGNYSITYEIHNDSNLLDRGVGNLVILPKLPEPSVGPAIFQAWLKEPVQLLIPYRGMVEPIQRFTVSGKLPSALQIENGMIIGTPTELGLFDLTVNIIDGRGNSYAGKITIRVGSRF